MTPAPSRSYAGKRENKKPAQEINRPRVETDVSVPVSTRLVYPSAETAFKALLSARFCAAIWNHISDCDETFNYWEPSHFLLFGKGLQTWEYSPVYALRSYTYLFVHVIPAWIYHQLFQPNRLLIFYFCRCILGFLCSFLEVYFYKSVCREFGIQVGRIMLAFMVFSAGMFVASTAYLPSTFSMYMCMASMGAWFHEKYELAIFTTALSSFLSWPFAALLGVPIALDMLFRKKLFSVFIIWSAISTIVILVPIVLIDSSYYGRFVVTPFNILFYNVFTSHGPDLYGTEPFSFYFINCFLNFNFVFVAAILTPFVLMLLKVLIPSKPRKTTCIPYYLSLMPMYLWMIVFFLQPHKEERFMFPIYPLICLCGAITVDAIQKIVFCLFVKNIGKESHYVQHTTAIMVVSITVFALISISRIFALYHGYHAPLDLFMEFSRVTEEKNFPKDKPINICIGKEWYRYPSTFFLPDNRWEIRFLKSEFRGQLPNYFSNLPNATSIIPANMNDLNKEEPSRYFDLNNCHFLVDLESDPTDLEPNYSLLTKKWQIIKTIPFLDAQRSHRFFRAFFIPFLSSHYCTYSPYNLLQSVKI